MEALNLSQNYWRFMGIVDESYKDLWEWSPNETIWNQTTFSNEEVFEEILKLDLTSGGFANMSKKILSFVDVNTVFNGKCFSLHFNFPSIPANGVFITLKNIWKQQSRSGREVN